MRTWIALALLTAVAFSGCAADEPVVDATQDAGDGGNETVAPSVGNETVDNGTVNTPPVANLTADIVNGTAPLAVNFTITGSDADGDNLTWVLSVNGTEVATGTELPATVAYNFTEVGNFSVVLAVSDGQAVADATVVISAVAAPEVGGGFVQEVDGSFAAGVHGCLNNAYPNPASGATFLRFTPDDQTWNQPFKASFSATGPIQSVTVHFWKGTGTVVGTFTSATGTVEGTVPDGTDGAYLNACGGAQVSVSYAAGAI